MSLHPCVIITYLFPDEDFDKVEQLITIQASDSLSPSAEVRFNLVDDIFVESSEEDFLALIRLEQASFPALVEVDPDMMLALCRIRSDDGM